MSITLLVSGPTPHDRSALDRSLARTRACGSYDMHVTEIAERSCVLSIAMSMMSTLPEKFHPHKLFVFPKRKVGSKGEERMFRAEWCQQYPWLHYDVEQDTAFCYLCMTAEHQNKSLARRKRDPAFITKGFTYWKEATSAFKKHQLTDCHREATQVVIFQPRGYVQLMKCSMNSIRQKKQ